MTRRSFFIALAACMLFAACGKDDANNGTDNNGNGGGNGTDTGTETAGWVDLGLPSGLLWAKCNLGASSPEEYGDYYAWGETEPKEVYNWSTYRYCTTYAEGGFKTLTKYNIYSGYGTVDNLTTLEAMDDAATQRLGSSARIPTKAEWEELLDNTLSELTTLNSVYGRMLTSKVNGRSLFLPAAGNRWENVLRDAGEEGYYWSSSLNADDPDDSNDALSFDFLEGGYNLGDSRRCSGLSVRPVRSAR